MIDRQYIPLFVFVACLALALALAFFTNEWPTALAISLAGCAIALAMRNPTTEDHDTAFLEEDIAEMKANADQRDLDISALRTSVDELAGIVESLAADTSRISKQSGAVESEKLRAVVDAMGKRVESLEQPQKQSVARIDMLEQTIANLRTEKVQSADMAELRSVEPVAVNAPSSTPRKPVSIMDAAVSMPERAGRLRDRLTKVHKSNQVRGLPVFDDAGNPASLMLDDPADQSSVTGSIATLRHALTLIGSEGRDSQIFVRLRTDAITDPSLTDALAPLVEDAGDVFSRIAVIVPQAALQDGPPPALVALRQAGAILGLEQVTDWSADLAAMAENGLRYIAIDGPAMARSAQAQKGDPTRLKSVLQARGIDLIAANIETRMQLDAVNTLVPDFLAGPGLGEPTLMEVSV